MYQILIAYAILLGTIGVSIVAAIVRLIVNCVMLHKMICKEKEAK